MWREGENGGENRQVQTKLNQTDLSAVSSTIQSTLISLIVAKTGLCGRVHTIDLLEKIDNPDWKYTNSRQKFWGKRVWKGQFT